MADENTIVVDRDYVDQFSVKEFGVEKIMPTFFPDQTTSNLTMGAMGMTSEYISNITEDSFNTGSSLLIESFVTRAKMESSIFANSAIFQFSNLFTEAAECDFMLVIPEEDIRKNFISKEGTNYNFFYIDKDLRINVNGLCFTLDYDIEIRAVYREVRKGYVYSAKYIMDEYKNSISSLRDPYIKLRQTKTGLIGMQVRLKQYVRNDPIYEPIVENTTLKYTSIPVSMNGKLAGFDILYKAPSDSDYKTQLETRVIYSLPVKQPFCYYRINGSRYMELSFTPIQNYFQPEFNSEIAIILYTTEGVNGNFEEYSGVNVSVTKGEKYEYRNSWVVTAKPMSESIGGKEAIDIEGLRALTVEGFSTATSLNTENDLQLYFDNYKYRYGSNVFFTKKRNDAVELLFSAFMYLKKDDYMYPTNTLTLNSNILNLDYKDGGFYVLDPGYLFGYKGIDVYFEPVYFIIVDGEGEKYDVSGAYYDKDGNRDQTKDISLKELRRKILGGYVTETDHSYWRLLGDDSDKYHLFNSYGKEVEDVEPITVNALFERFYEGDLEYGLVEDSTKEIDFIIDTEKDAEARKDYIAYYDTYKTEEKDPNMTFEEYLFHFSFKDYKNRMGIDTRRTVFNTDMENFKERQKFMFTNPFILSIAKDTGLITYYQSFISQDAQVDFIDQNDEDSFAQFITYTFHVERDISAEKMYRIKMTFLPSTSLVEEEESYCEVFYDSSRLDDFVLYPGSEPSLANFRKELLAKNRMRVVLTFIYDGVDIGYMELIPTSYSVEEDHFTFEGEFYTDDFITSDSRFRTIHICPYCGNEILNSANGNIDDFDYYCDVCGNTFKEGIINIRESDSLLIPINEANIRITTLFKDPEKDKAPITDNQFVVYNPSYSGYIWTNIYETVLDPVTFIQPLDMMRSYIVYKDYYVAGVDALDCEISDIPLLKYSILSYKDTGMEITDPLLKDDIGKFDYFMKTFLNTQAILKEAKQFLNGVGIDMKFYNTYGRSTNFTIGEDGEIIDTNNIEIEFDVWYHQGVDIFKVEDELKLFIKDYIERVNETGSNNLYISNLIREIENGFSSVHHLVFKGINDYPVNYQAIINKSISLEDLTKEQRRKFVPDLLVVNLGAITLNAWTY